MACVNLRIVKVPRPEDDNGEVDPTYQEGGQEQLPVTLVRIPAQSQDPRTHHVEANGASS